MRYFLFCGAVYYPNGGWDDFHSLHKDLDFAKRTAEACLKRERKNNPNEYWAQIIQETGDGFECIWLSWEND